MKKMLILAALLLVAGSLIFTLTACNSDWSLGGEAEEKTTTVTDSVTGIDIRTDTANISFLPSEDGSCKVVSLDIPKIRYDASVENGVLKIKSTDTRKWFERIFNINQNSLTVYLPSSEYGELLIDEDTGNIHIPEKFNSIDIKLSTGNTEIYASTLEKVSVKNSTGRLTIKNISCGSIDTKGSTGEVAISGVKSNGNISIEVTTGDVSLSDINCQNLISDGDTGDITVEKLTAIEKVSIERSTGKVNITDTNCGASLNITLSTGKATLTNINCADLESEGSTGSLTMTNVIATGKFSIERSTGDVRFNGCDASEISVETDTGDVSGSLLSDKIFLYETDTGKVKLPETTSGGKCKIETDTGDIIIEIK